MGGIIARQRAAIARVEGAGIPLTYREVSRRIAASSPDGKGIHHNTVRLYGNDENRVPESSTLAQLARGLADAEHPAGALFDELQEAAGLPESGGLYWNPPDAILVLNRAERATVEGVIRAIAAAKLHGQMGHPPRGDRA